MARINEAFATLTNPDTRSEYDALIDGSLTEDLATSPKKPIVVKLRERLKSHRTPVYTISFSPDTGRLVSGAFDNEIIWWDEDSKVAERKKLDAGVLSVLKAVSDKRVVACGSSESAVSVWNLDGQDIKAWRNIPEEWVGCLAVSPDGQHYATGSVHRSLRVSQCIDGKTKFETRAHAQSVTAVAWSSGGKVLASGSADATVRLWDVETGKAIGTIGAIRSPVTAMAFSADDRFLCVASVDLSIRVFRMPDASLEKLLFGHEKPIEALAFHPNNWLFASAGRDGSLKLWNADKGLGQLHISASPLPLTTVAFSPDGTKLAAGGLDKIVRLWDIQARAAS